LIITDIEPQKNKNRVNIYLDDEFAFGLDREISYKYRLYIGQEIEKKFIEKILKTDERNKVINSALGYLSYRQRSQQEVFQKLRSKDYSHEDIEFAINYCIERNYINDIEFARSFIHDKSKLNKYGSVRIKYDLIKKGVDKSIIDQVLQADFEEEYSTALEVAEKKLASYRSDDKNSQYRKLGGFLQRRGYPYDVVSKVLRELL